MVAGEGLLVKDGLVAADEGEMCRLDHLQERDRDRDDESVLTLTAIRDNLNNNA